MEVRRAVPGSPAAAADRLGGGGLVLAAVVAACALAALGAYSPKAALGALAAAAFLAVAVSRLDVAVAVFVVVTFPAHLPGSLGAGATLAKPLGALLLLAWLVVVGRRRSARLLPVDFPAFSTAVAALAVLGGASALWAVDVGQVRYELGRIAAVVVLVLVAYTAASTRSGFATIVGGYLLGSVVTSLYSIGSGAYANGRLGGIFDPNYFAAQLVPAVAVSLFLFVTAGSRRVRWAAAAVAAVDLTAFVLTQSRGGIAGMAVALLAAVVLAGRARPRLLALVLVLVAGGLGYYLAYKPAHVFESVSGGIAGTSSGRYDEWRIALRVFGDHPLAGVGLGNYVVVEPSYAQRTLNLSFVRYIVDFRQVAHDTYLQVAAELGAAGLLLFLATLALPLRAAARALAPLERRLDPLEFPVRGLLAGALGMLASYVFLTATWEKQLWLVLALLAAAAAGARAQTARD